MWFLWWWRKTRERRELAHVSEGEIWGKEELRENRGVMVVVMKDKKERKGGER